MLGRERFAHRLRYQFASGTPSIRLIDCSLPGLRGLGNVAVADVDGGVHICMHLIAAMPADISVSFP